MENITELLDAAKHAKGVTTDYALAKSLDLPRARICDYYKGNRVPDEFACLKIAEALGRPLDSIIATVKAATEKDETRRKAWENYMKRLGGMAASFAAVVFLCVTTIVTSSPVEAAPALEKPGMRFVLRKLVSWYYSAKRYCAEYAKNALSAWILPGLQR